jgi:hypothetical protein
VLTTIEDFGKFGVAVINKEGVSDIVFNEMVTPQVNVRNGIDFGLGYAIFSDLSTGEYALFNAGGDPGTHTVIILLPKSKRGIIIFTNGDKGYLFYRKLIPKMLDIGAEIMNKL